jgi:hypothetical protein
VALVIAANQASAAVANLSHVLTRVHPCFSLVLLRTAGKIGGKAKKGAGASMVAGRIDGHVGSRRHC